MYKPNDTISITSISEYSRNEIDGSGDEAPEDKVYQETKIYKNYILKRIIKPGIGLEKPFKNDYIKYEFSCYIIDYSTKDQINENEFVSLTVNNNTSFSLDDRLPFNNRILYYFYKSKCEIKEFLKFSLLPTGIQKSISYMRNSEVSQVKVHPKYAFYNTPDNDNDENNITNFNEANEKTKKDNEADDNSNIDYKNTIEKLNKQVINNPNILFNSNIYKLNKNLYDLLQKRTLLYHFKLNSFIQYYDLTESEDLIKFIQKKGKGLHFPSDENMVNCHVKLRINNEMYDEVEFFDINIKDLCHEEKLCIKSMLLNEESVVEFSPTYLFNMILNKDNSKVSFHEKLVKTINDFSLVSLLSFSYSSSSSQFIEMKTKLQEFCVKNRFFYNIRLDLIKELPIRIYNNISNSITDTKLNEGLGNITPWDNNYSYILFLIKSNEDILVDSYSLFNIDIEMILNIKQTIINDASNGNYSIYGDVIQHKINDNLRKFYNQNIQIQSDLIKNLDDVLLNIVFDSYSLHLPKIITDILRIMKPLETRLIKFEHSDFILDYLKIGNYEIVNKDLSKEETFSIQFTLINFENNPFAYEEMSSEEERRKYISGLKSIANRFFELGLFSHSEKVNLSLINGLISKMNLKKQNVTIDFDFENDDLLQDLISKVHLNLVKCLLRKEENIKCREYINIFYSFYKNDVVIKNFTYFKIGIIYSIVLICLFEFDKSKEVIEDILFIIDSLVYDHCDADKEKINKIRNICNERLAEISILILKSDHQKRDFLKKYFQRK